MTTIVRGKSVVRDGRLVGDITHGEHLARDRSPYAKPRGVAVSGFEPAGKSAGLACFRVSRRAGTSCVLLQRESIREKGESGRQ